MTFYVVIVISVLMVLPLLTLRLIAVSRELRVTRRTLDGVRMDLIRQLREAEHFRMVAEYANDGIVIQDLDGSIVWSNPAYCKIIGFSADEMIGRNPMEFALPDEDRPPAHEIANFRYSPGEENTKPLQLVRNKRGDGTLFWNQISLSIRRSTSGLMQAILVCRDVTEQIEHEEKLREARNKLEFAATHDSLTGLANRAALMRFTEDTLSLAATRAGRIGMLHVDLDKFKEINDTHGHSAGDAALRHVAGALRTGIRQSDMVARIGGDEFVVICPGMSDLTTLRELGEALSGAISVPFQWGDHTLTAQTSMGAALSDPGSLDPEELLLRADFALYEAKREGRNQVAIYDERLFQRHMSEQRMASELKRAVQSSELTHLFQPTYCLENGCINGLETLVRWDHPEQGAIAPEQFIPLVEELGLMAKLDFNSVDAALEMKAHLNRSGHSDLRVAFNASGEVLIHPEFVKRLMSGVLGRGLNPSEIVIEVLETNVFGDLSDNNTPAVVIRELRDAGFKVMLDDFGMGYAGLAHLAHLAVSGVKIDQSLIRSLSDDETSAKIVATIIELCDDLNLEVVAEGVETRDIAERLHAMGCKTLQGYWVSRPLIQQDVVSWFDVDHEIMHQRFSKVG